MKPRQANEKDKKKPYRSPRLVVYGDLRRLTQKGGAKGDAGAVKTRL